MLTYQYRTCQDKVLGILEVIGGAAVTGGGEEFLVFSSQLFVEDEESANRNQREKSLQ
jgi:hypothetical protein